MTVIQKILIDGNTWSCLLYTSTVTTDEGLVIRMKETIAKQNIEKFILEMAAIGYSEEDVVRMINERGDEEK